MVVEQIIYPSASNIIQEEPIVVQPYVDVNDLDSFWADDDDEDNVLMFKQCSDNV